MKIFLLDINRDMTDAWKRCFEWSGKSGDVEIVNDSFKGFMDGHLNVEAVVSPGNSFGLMDGGYDKAITDYFGKGLMQCVQERILLDWFGEQPVGTSVAVPIMNRAVRNKKSGSKYAVLIHTPSMRTPEHIMDHRIVYQCMRTTLIEAVRQGAESAVIPAFGGSTGDLPYEVIAKMMFLGYWQVHNRPVELNWRYAWRVAYELM